jgi:hypothetical protein
MVAFEGDNFSKLHTVCSSKGTRKDLLKKPSLCRRKSFLWERKGQEWDHMLLEGPQSSHLVRNSALVIKCQQNSHLKKKDEREAQFLGRKGSCGACPNQQ